MNKFAISSLIAAGALLAACGSKSDASDKNFSLALDQYLAKKGDVCLGSMTVRKWPVEVEDTTGLNFVPKASPTDDAAQMKALESVGLAKGTYMEVDQLMGAQPRGRKHKVWRYELSDMGKKAVRDRSSGSGLVDLCFASKRIDKIVKWDAVENTGSAAGTNVTYLYKLDGLQDWATKPEIQSAFPRVKALIADAGKKEERHGVKLTSLGWEAMGMNAE